MIPFLKLVKRLLRPAKRFLPGSLLAFYREFRREYPGVDRSQVVLDASPDVLPGYTPRQSLLPSVPPFLNCEMGGQRGAGGQGGGGGDGGTEGGKVTLISTEKNEAAHAREWLESLLSQTRPPDEVVIADGGSTDGTLDVLQELATSFPIPIKIIEAPGANIARGRNLAIQHASHPIVACSDFGCVLDRDWLRLLVAPLEADPAIELSAGYYQAIETNPLSRLATRFFGIDLATINPQTFLPSGRSLAMRKTLWEKAGGYPEWLTIAGEDTLFDLQAKAQPARWAFVPQARVAWRAPDTLRKLFRTYYRYSLGDGEAGTSARMYWYKTIEVLLKTARRGALLLAGLLLTALLWPWALLYWAVWLGAAGFRFVRENLPLSAQLGAPFYPCTLLLEIVGAIQVVGYTIGVANRPKLRQRQVALYRQQLQDILASHPQRQGVVVYPPTHDWGFMFQRPHQMARAFARQGYLYFYCTVNEKTDSVVGFRRVEPNLYLYHGPLETFGALLRPIVYIGSPWNRSALPVLDHPTVIYDQYDDLEVSGGRAEDYEYLLQTADVMLTTSQLLYDPARQKRPDVLLIPNGVDVTHIGQSRPQPGEAAPPDLQPILDGGRPIVGYSGGLAAWLDYELLTVLSKACPEMDFVLIGVNYDGSLDRSGILELENVHWLGMKPYDELFRYVWRFDVGVIPFQINAITLSTSPIKLFEYMACRKPVVSTALPECRRYPGVFVAESEAQFEAYLHDALQARRDEKYLASIEAVARANTWERRVEAIIAALDHARRE